MTCGDTRKWILIGSPPPYYIVRASEQTTCATPNSYNYFTLTSKVDPPNNQQFLKIEDIPTSLVAIQSVKEPTICANIRDKCACGGTESRKQWNLSEIKLVFQAKPKFGNWAV